MSARLGALICPVSALCAVFLPRVRGGKKVFNCASVVVEALVFICASEAVGTLVFCCSLVGEFTLTCLSLPCFVRMFSHLGKSLLCYAHLPGRVPHSVCEWSVNIQMESTLHLLLRLRG